MHIDEDEDQAPRSLQECSDFQLAGMCMRMLYMIYDHGGHSGRSIRSQLLEAALFLCDKSSDVVPGDLRHCCEEAQTEIAIRAARSYQPGLFQELPFISTTDYLGLAFHRVRARHLKNENPSLVEGMWIDTLCELFGSDLQQARSFTDEEIISEGRNRVFYSNREDRELLAQAKAALL